MNIPHYALNKLKKLPNRIINQTLDNILEKTPAPLDFDFMVIDIDGNDCKKSKLFLNI